MRTIRFATLAALLLASPAAAQDATTEALGRIAVELGYLAVVVVFIESAMAAVFNWRVYRAAFNHRAVKMPIMVGVGLLIVLTFGYDVFARVLVEVGALSLPPNVTDADKAGNALTTLISAMTIAGGSSGINTLFLTLGLRSPLPDQPAAPKLDQTEAWISVLVNGAVPGKRYQVAIEKLQTAEGPCLAGSVAEKSFGERLAEAWQSSPNRFPTSGGRLIEVGPSFHIEVIDTEVAGGPKRHTVFKGSFAPRAIVDFDVTV